MTLPECRSLLPERGKELTDEQLGGIVASMVPLADVLIDDFLLRLDGPIPLGFRRAEFVLPWPEDENEFESDAIEDSYEAANEQQN